MPSLLSRRLALGVEAPTAPSVAELYHVNTVLQPNSPLGGWPPEHLSADEEAAMAGAGRRFSTATQRRLPPPGPLPLSLGEALSQRRTRRRFAPGPLDLSTLATLLGASAGLTGEETLPSGALRPLRAAPSAGGLYPVELYVVARAVESLPAGIYHYAPRAHALEELSRGDPIEALSKACFYGDSLRQSSLVVLYGLALGRTLRKYGDRGYRYALLDLGHLAQNMALVAEGLGLGMMTTCGYYDDRLHALLGLDGLEEAILYLAYLGPRGAP